MDRHTTGIDGVAAVEAARRGVVRYGVTRDAAVAEVLKVGKPLSPLLVEHLDEPKAYYLVPWGG